MMGPVMLRVLAISVALCLVASAASAQSPADVTPDGLSLEQKTKISQLVTRRTPPLGNPTFPVAVASTVPAEVQIHALPSDAEQVAPQLRGLGYIVVEELVAIVDPRTRKVATVFPRWGEQK
jgi:Protein of unknown function (DUF1236)